MQLWISELFMTQHEADTGQGARPTDSNRPLTSMIYGCTRIETETPAKWTEIAWRIERLAHFSGDLSGLVSTAQDNFTWNICSRGKGDVASFVSVFTIYKWNDLWYERMNGKSKLRQNSALISLFWKACNDFNSGSESYSSQVFFFKQ